MSDFPKMLFRPGDGEKLHGFKCSTLIVGDSSEEEAARAEGWAGSPAEAYDGLEVEPDAAPQAPIDPEITELRAYKADADEMIALLEGEKGELEQKLADALAERDDLKAKLAAFDGDGDGKPGGRRKKEMSE